VSLPELRKDPVLNRWVLVPGPDARAPSTECPICARVSELDAKRTGSVPHPHPVLDRKSVVDRSRSGGDLYMRASGSGEHELLIETSAHGSSFAELPVDHATEVLALYRERLLFLRQDNRFRHMAIVKNHGALAGALSDHACSEAFALPLVPPSVKEKIQGIQGYHRRTGSCAYCDIIKLERTEKSGRRIAESMRHIALAPYASRSPFEMVVMPKGHHADFTETGDLDLADLAGLLLEVLNRLDRVIDDCAYRWVLETAPPEMGADLQQFHWHLEIHPILDNQSSVMWSVLDVNAVAPEEAARLLREVEP
jgi:UDPglucose--hexose-1-phosphate uridylyltransferase